MTEDSPKPHFSGASRYVLDDEGGLLMCTWPQDDRPKEFIIYADEVWTGIEYQVAAGLMWEGMVDESLAILHGIDQRVGSFGATQQAQDMSAAQAARGILRLLMRLQQHG